MTTPPSTSLASTSRAGPAAGTSLVKVGGVFRAQEVCEGRGGRPGLSVPNSPYGLCEGGPAAGTSPVKVGGVFRAQELCSESRGGRPGLPVPNSPYGLCEGGPAAGTSPVKVGGVFRAQELCSESRSGRPGLPVPNSPYGLRGRTATLNMELRSSVKVDVAILGSPSLIVFTVSVKVVLQQVFHL